MGRQIEFHQDELSIQFTGLTSAAALKRHLTIPYSCIKQVTIGEFRPPFLTLRMGGTSMPGTGIHEGRFLHDGEWYFLSYEHGEHVIILELEGHEYKKVVFETENPEMAMATIQSRSSNGAK